MFAHSRLRTGVIHFADSLLITEITLPSLYFPR